jgi:hypothetical protein
LTTISNPLPLCESINLKENLPHAGLFFGHDNAMTKVPAPPIRRMFTANRPCPCYICHMEKLHAENGSRLNLRPIIGAKMGRFALRAPADAPGAANRPLLSLKTRRASSYQARRFR